MFFLVNRLQCANITIRRESTSENREYHITRIANKLIQLVNNKSIIQSHLQENKEWFEWQTTVLVRRNDVENVHHWVCGRPTSLHDRGRDSDGDDFRDRDYDVQALANNLRQAFQYGRCNYDDIEEDVDFDDEAAKDVISSPRVGCDQDSGGSLFTDSDLLFDGDEGMSERLAAMFPSLAPSPVDESQQGSVPHENDPVDETLEPAEVRKHTLCSKYNDERLLCTEHEDRSREAECHQDARDDRDGAPAENAASGALCVQTMGTERTVDEESASSSGANDAPAAASSDPGGDVDDHYARSAFSGERVTDGSVSDTVSLSQAKEERFPGGCVHGEKRANEPMTNE